MQNPRIATLECRPAPEGHIVIGDGELIVPVPDGWRLFHVIQAGPLWGPDEMNASGIRLQVILVPEPDTRLAP